MPAPKLTPKAKKTIKKKLFATPATKAKQQKTDANPESTFPDLTNLSAVQRAHTVAELQQMLKDAGAKTEGNKEQLAQRIIDLAHVESFESWTEHDAAQLNDFQVLFILQQFEQPISSEPKARRDLACELLLARGSEKESEQVDLSESQSEADDKMNSDLRAEVESLKAQLRTLADLQTRDRSNEVQQAADTSADGTARIFADAIVRAIQDNAVVQSDGSSAADSHSASRIKRTAPSLIDPRNHDNDAHKLGLLINRMIVIDFATSEGLSAVSWKRACADRVAVIHELINCDASPQQYSEGEARFFTYVSEMITLAGQYDGDVRVNGPRCQNQLLRWMMAWEEILQNIRDATRFWREPTLAYRLQMEDLMATAMGVGLSNAQLKNLQTTCKLRGELGGGVTMSGGSGSMEQGPTSMSYGGGSQSYKSAPSTARGQGGRDGGPQLDHGKRAGDRGSKGSGQRMPEAKAIIGADTEGAVSVNTKCYSCGFVPTVDGEGHKSWECPVRFAKEHPGRSFPGFDTKGQKKPGAWNGNNITSDTKKQWDRMRQLGFFNESPAGAAGAQE